MGETYGLAATAVAAAPAPAYVCGKTRSARAASHVRTTNGRDIELPGAQIGDLGFAEHDPPFGARRGRCAIPPYFLIREDVSHTAFGAIRPAMQIHPQHIARVAFSSLAIEGARSSDRSSTSCSELIAPAAIVD